MDGVVLKQGVMRDGVAKVSGAMPGMYLIRVQTGMDMQTQKIMLR
ncbi:MAG: T9SS type A sorting domain-containing protein, partial [Bacteroidetes bacterium]|nr:T9SS type A sorting domain-containing protein [Bacteroidota bacterium]